LLGRVVRITKRDKKELILTGEMNDTGGTFVYFQALIDLFLQAGYRVTVLLLRRNCGMRIRELSEEKAFVLKLIPNSPPLIEFLWLLLVTVRLKASRIIVSASGPGSYTGSLLLAIPTVQIFHSSPGASTGARERRLVSWFFKAPHRIVAVSENNREAIIQAFRLSAKRRVYVRRVYNGIEEVRAGTGKSEASENMVLTIGHVAAYKNPSVWLDTAQYVLSRVKRRTSFVWAGDGPELEHYREMAEKTPMIRFVGYAEDVGSLLNKCTVYYQPSDRKSVV
jgi:glycosyltransferase involved in cell wall biosynthesis